MTRIVQHRSTDLLPGVLGHQLPFVEHEEVGIVTAQGVGVPASLSSDTHICPWHLNRMEGFVLD